MPLLFLSIISIIFICTKNKPEALKKIFVTGIIFLTILTLINSTAFMRSILYFHLPQLFKSPEETKKILFGWTYSFAKDAKEKWPGYHRVELQSDLDFSLPEPMTIHRQLAYFLYPIDIRVHPKDRPTEGILFLEKKVIPENLASEDMIVFYGKNLFLIKK